MRCPRCGSHLLGLNVFADNVIHRTVKCRKCGSDLRIHGGSLCALFFCTLSTFVVLFLGDLSPFPFLAAVLISGWLIYLVGVKLFVSVTVESREADIG